MEKVLHVLYVGTFPVRNSYVQWCRYIFMPDGYPLYNGNPTSKPCLNTFRLLDKNVTTDLNNRKENNKNAEAWAAERKPFPVTQCYAHWHIMLKPSYRRLKVQENPAFKKKCRNNNTPQLDPQEQRGNLSVLNCLLNGTKIRDGLFEKTCPFFHDNHRETAEMQTASAYCIVTQKGPSLKVMNG